MDPVTKVCPFCNGEAKLAYVGMKGYVEGEHFDIYVCGTCGVSSVDPLKTDEEVYEYIYKQAEIMPGYERYHRYAQLVKKVRNPLALLSNSESVYWSVAQSLKQYFPGSTNVSILEIGSGLGYLTYALNKAGYSAKGIDISEDAVSKANKRYGNYYEYKNLFKIIEENERYDCVIMTEVIEHVEDPVSFIGAALKLLKSEGKLIVTTPNKNATQQGTVWHSDFPPVHLWFFTEESVKHIADKFSKKCEFLDFSEYSKKFYSPMYTGTIEDIQRNVPRLDREGVIMPNMIMKDTKTKMFGLYGRYLLSYIRRRLKRKTVNTKSTTMCAVIG